MKKRLTKILILLIGLACLLSLISGCSNQQQQYIQSADELNGKHVAVWPGSKFEEEAKKAFPEMIPEYLGEINVCAEALNQDKIDAIAYDKAFAKFLNNSGNSFSYLTDFSTELNYGLIFSNDEKGNKYQEEFNKYLAEIKANGEFKRLQDKYIFSGEEFGPEVPINSWDTSNGTVKISTTGLSVPFSYVYENDLSGYEAALVFGFCQTNQYKVEISIGTFEAMLADIDSCKSNIGFQTIEITDERKEIIMFSDPTYTGEMVFFVKRDPATLPEYTLDELNGKIIANITGSIDYLIADTVFPDSEQLEYNTANDTIVAVKMHKADFCITNTITAYSIEAETDGITVLDEPVYFQHLGIGFQKNTTENDFLQAQVNEFIGKLVSTGKNNEIRDGWVADQNNRPLPVLNVTEDAKEITIAIIANEPPYNFVRNGEYAGFDIEFIYEFCNEYNYKPNFYVCDFGGLIPAVASGKVDFCMSNLCITPERSEAVDFSDPYVDDTISVLVRTKGNNNSFIDDLKESFEKTFIREDRYKLILSGINTTIEITIVSIILGTILGFLLYTLTRKNVKLLNKFLELLSKISNGLPIIVILMILCYVIFGKSDISGTYVAIIGFTITLALEIYPALSTSVAAIDQGQLEGAYAVGFTDRQAFYKIIIPQAMKIFIPGYISTLVALLKGTAIVGYVAVQDLTKMSELIRARTYEAFFPLISTAIIYLLLGLILTFIVKQIGKLFTPELRTNEQILKQFKK